MVNPNIDNDIIFEPKADAVPFNYRISYKVSLICLIIGKCCGKRGCSAIKIQMINSAISSLKLRRELLDAVENIRKDESTLIRFDPSISRAINIAISNGLIYQQSNGLFRLTEMGKSLIVTVDNHKEIMIAEKDFFQSLSSKLTEEFIAEISQSWR